jgi:hypothetical protein
MEKKMEMQEKVNLSQAAESFLETRERLTQTLAISGENNELVEEICRIVTKENDQKTQNLIFFLNCFCLGSPKRFRLLEYSLEGRSVNSHESVIETLVRLGLMVHGRACKRK